ncbi:MULTISPECIES: GNAT family N-acetyltransferase [Burkholderia]|uniref:GNAT family N-acetyltransferase n=1 Tax=Burkholderia TaxID=32008 RepID=UPI00075BABDD|nr:MULTISPECIES: GNAT family N-acetyltransferase [Burkholderia]AOJ73325.1 GCN5 family acetyltransferase [Burkholderia savannae]KVG47021.1 GCN5 family acetyltransferase [Burkholderia sp. MSMB0265]KVG85300.1 GCN5 family acetyltransferase [Burkholderia sp. MSMB2040]KVG91095.1 GCN5 family acetyltransferase [Burkholderia sp. MSMB2041]KVG95208.1 GCN5 family acetyltransferase [Burkholderia sp. MSMB2042]
MAHPASSPCIEIRRLRAAHAADYRAIRLAALKDAPDAFGSTYEAEAARPPVAFAERLDSAIVFGAYVDGAIAGMAGFKRQEGAKERHKGFLWGMYVAPAARRRGVGAALLDAVLAAAEQAAEQVTLAVADGNGAARAFYERHGFVAYGVEPRALKGANGYADEWLMVKFLPSAPPRA